MKKFDLVVDSFAGGGGASLGLEWALGRPVDIAINHDLEALRMHAKNHPKTRHVREDVWLADLKSLCRGRRIGHLHASPDCKDFSRAKGSMPKREKGKEIRSLAWAVVKWAVELKPSVITLENVSEFAQWGPVVPRVLCKRCGWKGTHGQSVLVRKRAACPACQSVRLEVTEEYVPNKAKKGLTFRRWVGRLRNLGYDVEWRVLNAADFGAPTMRKRLFLIARCDGQSIKWPSPTHGAAAGLKPHRTAAECIDWDIPCPSIFDRKKPLVEKTMRRIALGLKRYVLEAETPYLVPLTHSGERRSHPLDEPVPTITGANRGELALVSPILSKYHHSKSTNDARCAPLDEPMRTLDTQPRYALVAAFCARHFGGMVGREIDRPLPTTTTRACQNQLVAASLVRHQGGAVGAPIDRPLPTAGGAHAALVYAFMAKYFGTAIGAPLDEPMHTQTTKGRFGLVTVVVDGESYVVVDIGMRMLTPRELARAQGFPESYELTGTKTHQIAKIGNSVPPQVIAAIAAANHGASDGNVSIERELRKAMANKKYFCVKCGGTWESINPRQGVRRCWSCSRQGWERRMVAACPCGNRPTCEGLNGRANGCDECCGHAGSGSEACEPRGAN